MPATSPHKDFLTSPHHATLGLVTLACIASAQPLAAVIGGVAYVLGWVYLPDMPFFTRWREKKITANLEASRQGGGGERNSLVVMSKLETVLKTHELEPLQAIFESQGIDDSMLDCLTDQDLLAIGVTKLGDRKKLLKAFSRHSLDNFGGTTNRSEVVETQNDANNRASGRHFVWWVIWVGSVGSVFLIKSWQVFTNKGSAYVAKDKFQWLVFAGALLGLSLTIWAWIVLRFQYKNQWVRGNTLPCVIAAIISYFAVEVSIPDSTNRRGPFLWAWDRYFVVERAKIRRAEYAAKFEQEKLRKELLQARIAGIYERQFPVLITGKNTTESYELRSNGDSVYRKDTGLGLGGLPIGGPFGNSQTKGTWYLDNDGRIVTSGGPYNRMRVEGDDLIDMEGNRWFRAR